MNELVAALRKIHIPMLFLIPFSVMYRYLPTIRQEFNYIHESLVMRGLHSSYKKVAFHPLQSAEHYLVPLLFRSEQIVEEYRSYRCRRIPCSSFKLDAGTFFAPD